jgi:hypothetical protein
MSGEVSQQDRDAITDTLMRYVWCMDSGDVEGLVGCFTPDGGVVKDFRDTLWDAIRGGARGFANNYITTPGRRGGQHWVQQLYVEALDGGAVRATSYWIGANLRDGTAGIGSLGRYIDTCVKVDGHWLIQNKTIDPWNSDNVQTIAPVVAAASA